MKQFLDKTHLVADFWQNSFHSIEELTHTIEQFLFKLENEYRDFQGLYDALLDHIDVLISLYSSFNNLNGIEYLYKLRATLKEYYKRYTHEGINFNVIYYLHQKVTELREEGFRQNQEKKQCLHKNPSRSRNNLKDAETILPFKWITFQRKNSWFITPFAEIEIIEARSAKTQYHERDQIVSVEHGGIFYSVIDFFPSSGSLHQKNNYFLLVTTDNGAYCYAADKMGKKIMARRDWVSMKISPFHLNISAKGYVKLFGIKHIFFTMGAEEYST